MRHCRILARGRILAIGLALVFVFSSVLLADHHVNGKWVLTVDLGGQGGDATFELEEADGKLSGTYSGSLGSADISGTVDGNNVEFSFESDAGKVTYKGEVDGDTMSGECSYGDLGSGTFAGKRQE